MGWGGGLGCWCWRRVVYEAAGPRSAVATVAQTTPGRQTAIPVLATGICRGSLPRTAAERRGGRKTALSLRCAVTDSHSRPFWLPAGIGKGMKGPGLPSPSPEAQPIIALGWDYCSPHRADYSAWAPSSCLGTESARCGNSAPPARVAPLQPPSKNSSSSCCLLPPPQ